MDRTILFLFLFIFNSVYSDGSKDYINFRNAFDTNLYENVINEEQCLEQLNFLANNTLGMHFLDASAKLPSGVLIGNINDLGDYFQCLGIDEVIDNMEIQGKYCAIVAPLNQEPIQIPEVPEWPDIPWPELPWPELPWPQPDNETIALIETHSKLRRFAEEMTGQSPPELRIFPMVTTLTRGLTLGVCIPKVCSAKQAIDFVISQAPFVNLTYTEYFCRLPNDKRFSGADYTAAIIFSLIAVIIVVSTIYDLHHIFVLKRDLSSINNLYSSFSVYTNTRRFLTFNSPPGSLECIDGIRAISMMWVIVGHTYCMTLLAYIHNLRFAVDNLTSFKMTWINAAPITVDTFFMLSGILAVYTTVGKITRPRFLRTLHLFYLNRLLRMFPLLATVILLQASVFNYISDGPFWQNVAHATENCRTYWWSALLHIQNFVNPVNVCLSHTWYLSVDVQLYIVCPLLMVFLFGREFIAWGALTFFVLLSLVGSTVYSFLYNFSAALANPARLGEFNDYVTTYYINTLCRAAPFFIGMVYGYLLHINRDKKLRMSKLNVIVLWIISFTLMAFCIISIYPVMQPEHTGQIFDNLLNAYMRAIWACSLGWLIFACVQGYGGPINWFLSLRMWKLPARLSYAMYLIHLPIIFTANGSWVKTHYFTNGEALYRFMSDITLAFIAAFILCICIDAPFSTLQKLLMNAGKKPQRPRPKPESQISNIEKTAL